MKKIFFKLIFILALVSAGFLTSCEDEGTAEQTTLTITSIEPLTAREGDTITINGTGFASDRTQNTVAFASASGRVGSGEQGLVASATETQLKVVIPDYAYSGALYVSYREQSVTSSQEFILDESLRAPVITAISPANGYVGSQVTITGDNFGTDASLVKVLFGETEATILSVTMTQILANVPKSLSEGEVTVKIKREEEITNEVTFTVDPLPVAVKTVYWSATGSHLICRGNITASGVQIDTLYDAEDGLSSPRGVAIDKNNNLIYWANGGTKTIMRAPLDGSGTPETVFSSANGLNSPQDIAIDVATNTLYIINMKSTKLYYISKADLSSPGSALQHIYTVSTTDIKTYPTGIKLDLTNNKLYWTESYSGRIMKGSLDGSIDGSTEPVVLFDSEAGLVAPNGLAIDATAGKIYITDAPYELDHPGSIDAIYKGNLDGTGTLTSIISAEDNLYDANDVELDLENGYIFWLNSSTTGSDGLAENASLMRAKLDGSSVETIIGNVKNGSRFELDIE